MIPTNMNESEETKQKSAEFFACDVSLLNICRPAPIPQFKVGFW
jgi:hypothetical protein